MPTYEYQCTKCDHSFEIIQKITDDPISDCEKCGGRVRKVMFPVGIVFKGSGFHINDYRKPEKSSASSTPKDSSSSS
jgi:putative FmdB family regulatory protein